jgi:hypothetical protein
MQYSIVIQRSTNPSHEQYRICTEYYSIIDDRIVSMYIYIFTNWRHRWRLHINPHAVTKFDHPIVLLAIHNRKINRCLLTTCTPPLVSKESRYLP